MNKPKCPFADQSDQPNSSNSADDVDHSLSNQVDLQAVMNTVLDGVIIIDKSGTIKSFNPAAVKIFGYQAEEVIGRNVKVLMPDPYHTEHDTYLDNYITTKIPKVIGIGREVTGKRKNGSTFAMELGVNGFRADNELMFVGTVRDISDRKAVEKEIYAYITALKRSNQELDDFAYIASHDLKEPLRGISNNASFLKEDYKDALDSKAIQRLDRIMFLCGRMENLIEDLLYFSRLGKQDLAVQETDLNLLLEDLISVFEDNEPNKGDQVKILIKSKLPTIICDSVRITEVFRNLISNGLKYNDKNEKIIEITAQNDGIICVKDNGIGIPEACYDDIFRIFKRLNIEDENVRGSGVGLTFVKKIIENHGGKIWVESQVGDGSRFYIDITGK